IESALMARLVPHPGIAMIQRATELLARGDVRVTELAAAIGLGERQLRRVFLDLAGVTPKVYARGVRLQRALALVGPQPSWAAVAVAAGYYDQAHMIDEFHQLAGATPRALVEELR